VRDQREVVLDAAGERGIGCHPQRVAEFREGAALAIDYATALGCKQVNCLAGIRPPHVDPIEARETFIRNLQFAAPLFKDAGIKLLIEPINTRDMPGYLLNRQGEAHQIVEQIGAPNLKVQMDLYHCQIVEGDVAMKLRQYLPTGRVGHLQIAGVPDRHEPDQGELNYPYLFEQLDLLGWQGYIGCEYRPRAGTSAGLAWLQACKAPTTSQPR
jgi:hydroxypyruvate isomerase